MISKDKRKIIFFDIDGTLIDDTTKLMSESTKAAISRARANGHICLINTGRTKRMVGRDITEQTEFDGYLMGCGTMIVYHDEVLFHKTLSEEETRLVLDAMEHHQIDGVLEGRWENFSKKPEDMYTKTFENYARGYAKYNYATIDRAVGSFDKLFGYGEAENMERFRKELEDRFTFIDRENGYYEIVPKGYSKATAMEYIAERLQIPMENTVAIGDSNNDLAMLQCAHTSIAMGNSSANVLELADYITTDVNEDGIWNALKWLGVLDG